MSLLNTNTRTRQLFLSLALIVTGAASANAALPQAISGQPLPSLAPLVKEVSPAVVNIQVKATVRSRGRSPFQNDPNFRRFFGVPDQPTEREVQGQGSGVIVDAKNGYIITNNHVVEDATEIQVTLQDERVLIAEVVGTDPGTDIAVLKVTGKDLVEAPFGNSDQAEVGDFVVAIGNPFGLSHTVTSGIVSALGRTGIGGIEAYEDFIQTDASINPGNSGGALINLRGELIGINSAILSRTGGNMGIGFAIPSNITQSIMRQILEFGEVRRGLLGVEIDNLSREDAEIFGLENSTGAIITKVSEGSAAEKAGIEVQDVVTSVNGKKIDSGQELRNAIGLLAAGDKVKISIVRDRKPKTITAVLGSRASVAETDGGQIHPGLAGARFASNETQRGGAGVEFESVDDGSPAAGYGFLAGDIIMFANQRPVSSIADLTEVAADARTLWLAIRRGNTQLLRQIR